MYVWPLTPSHFWALPTCWVGQLCFTLRGGTGRQAGGRDFNDGRSARPGAGWMKLEDAYAHCSSGWRSADAEYKTMNQSFKAFSLVLSPVHVVAYLSYVLVKKATRTFREDCSFTHNKHWLFNWQLCVKIGLLQHCIALGWIYWTAFNDIHTNLDPVVSSCCPSSLGDLTSKAKLLPSTI